MMEKKRKYNWVSDFVYGGVDGAVTTFAVVAGVEGASLSLPIILVLGFANLFADGFSMAVGKYLSSKAELDQENGENIRNIRPLWGGFITFVSFVTIGFIPLFAYVFKKFFNFNEESLFILTSTFTLVALFIVGAVKAKFTKTNWFKSGIETMFVGGLAATIAYLVGYFLQSLV